MTGKDQEISTIPPELSLGVLSVNGPSDVIRRATNIATELAAIVKSRKLFSNISGKAFVRVEGWSTLGAMLGILPREVSAIRLEDGSYEAVVELIRVNDGAIVGRGSAICGMDEKDKKGNLTWANRAEYARRSMAITRATGKAYRLGFSWIMALAGYEPTPAEEMDAVVEGEIIQSKPKQKQRRNGNGPTRPLSPGKLREFLWKKAGDDPTPATEKQPPFVARKFTECYAPDKDAAKFYHLALNWLWGVTSANDLTKRQAMATLDWLLDPEGADAGGFAPLHKCAADEAARVYRAALTEQGQQELFDA